MPNDMRDRLIELIDGFGDDIAFCDICDRPEEDCEACKNEQLADYLIENGAILPPCKVGDTVYFFSSVLEEVCESKVIKIEQNYYTPSNPFWFSIEYLSKQIGTQVIHIPINQAIGKTVFLTREDAEKALREREGE